MKERGSITKLLRNQRPRLHPGEDGCMVAFDESSLDGPEVQKLSVGDWWSTTSCNRPRGGELPTLGRFRVREEIDYFSSGLTSMRFTD